MSQPFAITMEASDCFFLSSERCRTAEKQKKSGGGVAIVIWIIIDIFAPQNNHLYRIIPNVIFSYGENVPYLLSEKWSNIIMTERF